MSGGEWRAELLAARERAEADLRRAREGLAMVEHCADDGPELARYEEALRVRNLLRTVRP